MAVWVYWKGGESTGVSSGVGGADEMDPSEEVDADATSDPKPFPPLTLVSLLTFSFLMATLSDLLMALFFPKRPPSSSRTTLSPWTVV